MTLRLIFFSGSLTMRENRSMGSFKHMICLLFFHFNTIACESFIDYQEGEVPILLTSAHGAKVTQVLPNIPFRTGKDINRFVTKADQFTDQITQEISNQLHSYDMKPFIIIAGIHRSQVDFNRKPVNAYESQPTKDCYDLYHQKIRHFTHQIRSEWKEGFLIDIHGQSTHDYDIIRGTRNKKTISRLIYRFGFDPSESQDGFYQLLRDQGYRVYPAPHQKEDLYYGGFTLNTYGSHRPDGIDAFQVEISRSIRIDERARRKLSLDIATSITHFYRRYYKDN